MRMEKSAMRVQSIYHELILTLETTPQGPFNHSSAAFNHIINTPSASRVQLLQIQEVSI